MTERLFFTHDHLTAELEVLSCTPHEEQFAVILQSTIFHPQGGGQPFDTGWLGEATVLRATQEADRVVHYVDRPLEPGPITARVDEQRRMLNTRLHSAGHLIGNVGETLGWMPIKAHHWPGEGKITFIRGEAAQAMDAEAIQQQVNQWIAADYPRHMNLEDGTREVGFGELPAYACGGTHVQALSELGQVTILTLSEKKGALSVRYELD
ncbi:MULTISPECIES: serine-tRNA(Ala) deacylase AlaX [Pseudomonas]|uniref:Alanyl-tRNA synthetase n=1 Tax=Pseudomonas fluorescens LMG 5329 TaxID=1324332 RepID=A0A0A1Z1A7_PSEFL|nr:MULTISPECIES: serine-tRNA(Ala) deacylase AlaX [Pseudomonas]KGE67983.1 alanyl-tRNA synthetase [Pseudomonas fluorescens LMG 5329]NWC87712.1 serine-tRNA(Ala) deacylase AlaX [Pseudomonas reactans]NWD33403.1 serine-tRNA(Ala) deacylase AlaX [Pseudomonas reactans]NWD99589.1 serine-tRNA(Ala) deacylase AlaX [Pseudomonas sp. IPO3749]NWF20426.1 serine-tRNA(Ala) deacylase AlaX [Pseudomonas sp. IPO3749]